MWKSCRMGGSGASAVSGRWPGCHRDVFSGHFGLWESGGMASGVCPAAAAADGGAATGCWQRNTGLGETGIHQNDFTWRKWRETGGFGVDLNYVVFLWDETILKKWPLYFGMFGICRDHEWLKHQGCLSLQCGHCGLRQSGSVASLAADFAADGVPSGAVLGLPTWGKHQQSPKIAARPLDHGEKVDQCQ